MQTLILQAEFQLTPTYLPGADDAFPEPEDLPISADLAARIDRWRTEYDATLDHEYPPWSGFAGVVAAQRWLDEARSITAQLAAELPASDWEVRSSYENVEPEALLYSRPADGLMRSKPGISQSSRTFCCIWGSRFGPIHLRASLS